MQSLTIHDWYILHDFSRVKLTKKASCQHTVRLTIWYQLFLELWLAHNWYFAHPRHQRHQHAETSLENVRQLNIRWGKKLDINLSNRQSTLNKLENTSGTQLMQFIIVDNRLLTLLIILPVSLGNKCVSVTWEDLRNCYFGKITSFTWEQSCQRYLGTIVPVSLGKNRTSLTCG